MPTEPATETEIRTEAGRELLTLLRRWGMVDGAALSWTARVLAIEEEAADEPARETDAAMNYGQGFAAGRAAALEELTHEPNHYEWFMPENPTADVDSYLDDFEAKLRESLTDPYVHDMAHSVLPLIAAYRQARAAVARAIDAMDTVRAGLEVNDPSSIEIGASSILRHAAREAHAALATSTED